MRSLLVLGGCTSEEVTGDIDWLLTPSELAAAEAKAAGGDNGAAQTVAAHYREAGPETQAIKWMEFAARRGDCNAILLPADPAQFETADRVRWQALADEWRCLEVEPRLAPPQSLFRIIYLRRIRDAAVRTRLMKPTLDR